MKDLSPSQLYHLKPIGIGTVDIESLTSYIKRLAFAHNLTTGILVNKIILPNINKEYLQMANLIEENRHSLNSFSGLTKKVVDVLENKTLNKNLKYLTLIPWENHVYRYKLHKKWHSWCPICYEEMKQAGQVVYDKLIWNIEGIDICKKHQIKLSQICPNCGNKFRALGFRSIAGYCDKCQTWLGLNINGLSSINDDWHNQVYDNVGKLLVITSTEPFAENQFTNNIYKIFGLFTTKQKFYKTYNITEPVFSRWLKGNRPSLINALILSLQSGLSLYEILTKEIDLSNVKINDGNYGINHINRIKKMNRPNKDKDYDKIKNYLNSIISSYNGISLTELCINNNICIYTLKKHFPNEAKLIIELYENYQENKRQQKYELLKNTMYSLHEKNIYPSIHAVYRAGGKSLVITSRDKFVWIETLKELGYAITDDPIYIPKPIKKMKVEAH